MRVVPRAATVLAMIAASGVPGLAAPSTVAAASITPTVVINERVYVESTVDSDHDGRRDRVAIDITRPDTTAQVPVVFEHSPYRGSWTEYPFHNVDPDRLPQEGLFGGGSAVPDAGRLGGPANTKSVPALLSQNEENYFLANGYAMVLGYSIGTGPSDGCATSGDRQETLGTTAVIDWLNGRARGFDSTGQPVTASWSTGNVGMIGASYNGTLPNMAASTGVAGLKAIVPIAAISSWYDYYRANGLVVAPGGYQGEDTDVLAGFVGGDRLNCASQLARLTNDQDRRTGDYNAFWRDRDYVDASRVTAGVFVVHGQSDWNVKGQHYAQWYDSLRRHDVPRKIWLHRGGHGGPGSRPDFQDTVIRWFDYFVKGIDNGIVDEPMAEVEYTDGTWRQYADWPDPAARNTVLNLSATSSTAPGRLSLGRGGGNVRQNFVDQGRTNRAPALVADPDTANPNRLVYRTGPLPETLRLSGAPRVTVRAAVTNRKAANLTALLVDYGPAGSNSAPVIVTRGWLDPQNRAGKARSLPVMPGQEYDLTFNMQPRDYYFSAGRRIGLVIISTDYDYTLRPPGGTGLRVVPGRSSLILPLVGHLPHLG
ncbi:Xaa-Pro dipeptidyl-peptidase [Micromonospora sonneratiae]|uniref:Xaa-Pro dipeptidyl-peptidase n=1 Tax=Micromonospora sonneratiae TaxID=1184706 RepID=A0ABW3YKE3_9ACTN